MMSTAEIAGEQGNARYGNNSLWVKICLITLFLLAALTRRDDIRAPGHLIEREYNSAIFAHAFYFDGNPSVEEWRRENARTTMRQFPVLEPPLTEYLVSLIYRVMRHEEIWYSRYLTGIFWLVGGWFFYKSVQALMSVEAALVAVGYYLFVPWGIIISRSFQPDSLMMMMFMISLNLIIAYFDNSTRRNLLVAGVVAGITLLLRPLVLFSLLGAFVALALHRKQNWLDVFDRRLVIFVFLGLAFPIAFYGYGIYIGGFLHGQAELSFRPYLLPRWEFWQGWFNIGARVAGYAPLMVAIPGFFLLPGARTRFLIGGMAVGYFVFGLLFTFHIHTHPYYHIQLFPLIGICMAPILVAIAKMLRDTKGVRFWWMPIMAILLLAVYFSWRDVRGTLDQAVFEDPGLARELGDATHHSSRVVFVAYHYGVPLEYYGEFSGAPWPVRIDDPFYRQPDAKELSVQERLDGLGFIPEFFVITNFDLYYTLHQDLRSFLESNCSVVVAKDAYLIYTDCGVVSDT